MGWSFRRSKSFGPLRLNFSKSGIGYSFGVKGARVGVNAKGKKYLRGGIPGTGLYYQSSLPDTQSSQPPQSMSSVSPFAILITILLVVGFIIFAMSSSTPATTSAPVAPVPQVVVPVAAPVVHKHVVKKHRRKHVVHRAPATTTKLDEVPAAEPVEPDVKGRSRGSTPARLGMTLRRLRDGHGV